MLLKNYRRFKFLSTPSARRATQKHMQMGVKRVISIHALREEGDDLLTINFFQHFDFYPRPPRGGRPKHHAESGADLDFYPRPPRGGRQVSDCEQHDTGRFLSTPSARRATGGAVRLCMRSGISIHALREEGDMGLIPPFCTMSHFYPRPPRGGRQVDSSPAAL